MFTGISLKKWLDKSLISWKDIYIYFGLFTRLDESVL